MDSRADRSLEAHQVSALATPVDGPAEPGISDSRESQAPEPRSGHDLLSHRPLQQQSDVLAIRELLDELDDLSEGLVEVACGVAIIQGGNGDLYVKAATDHGRLVAIATMARGLSLALREGPLVLQPIDALNVDDMHGGVF